MLPLAWLAWLGPPIKPLDLGSRPNARSRVLDNANTSSRFVCLIDYCSFIVLRTPEWSEGILLSLVVDLVEQLCTWSLCFGLTGLQFCYFSGVGCETLGSLPWRGIPAISKSGEFQESCGGEPLVLHRKQRPLCSRVPSQVRAGLRDKHQTWNFERSAAAVHRGTTNSHSRGRKFFNFSE